MSDTTRQALSDTRDTAAIREAEAQQTGDGTRFHQNRILDELPGLAFAAITLVWVITCFAGLIW